MDEIDNLLDEETSPQPVPMKKTSTKVKKEIARQEEEEDNMDDGEEDLQKENGAEEEENSDYVTPDEVDDQPEIVVEDKPSKKKIKKESKPAAKILPPPDEEEGILEEGELVDKVKEKKNMAKKQKPKKNVKIALPEPEEEGEVEEDDQIDDEEDLMNDVEEEKKKKPQKKQPVENKKKKKSSKPIKIRGGKFRQTPKKIEEEKNKKKRVDKRKQSKPKKNEKVDNKEDESEGEDDKEKKEKKKRKVNSEYKIELDIIKNQMKSDYVPAERKRTFSRIARAFANKYSQEPLRFEAKAMYALQMGFDQFGVELFSNAEKVRKITSYPPKQTLSPPYLHCAALLTVNPNGNPDFFKWQDEMLGGYEKLQHDHFINQNIKQEEQKNKRIKDRGIKAYENRKDQGQLDYYKSKAAKERMDKLNKPKKTIEKKKKK